MNAWHSLTASRARAVCVKRAVSLVQRLSRLGVAAVVGAPMLAGAGTWQTLANPPPLPDIVDQNGVFQYPGGAGFPLKAAADSVRPVVGAALTRTPGAANG